MDIGARVLELLFRIVDEVNNGMIDPAEFNEGMYRMKTTVSKTATTFVKHSVTRTVEVHKELNDRLKKMLDAQPELQKEEEQWQQRRREQVRHTREAIEVAFNKASEVALVASLTDRELVLTTVPQAKVHHNMQWQSAGGPRARQAGRAAKWTRTA
jgi:phage-related tail protein